jgi:alkanesulfonate monooxygenase SsuD/methylene tetrahydromethanopterin reductase-like flavin-dependent oxidoreductase (luciferase family)
LSFGAGYLKGEYFALGANFDLRNELMDEYLQAMKAAWTGEVFDFEGTGYSARGNRMRPRPVQTPHPPLYIGGNSRRAIRRVVELADGWNPFFTPESLSSTARTASMTSELDLADGIAYMREHCEKVGRENLPHIFLASITRPGEKWTPQQLIDKIGQFKEMGVIGAGVSFDGRTRAEWCDNAERFGADVIAKL